MLGLTSVDRVSASDPKSALALQRLVQAAVSIVIYSEDLAWSSASVTQLLCCIKFLSLLTAYAFRYGFLEKTQIMLLLSMLGNPLPLLVLH